MASYLPRCCSLPGFPGNAPDEKCAGAENTLVLDPDADLHYTYPSDALPPAYCTNAAEAIETLGLRGETFRYLVLHGQALGAGNVCQSELETLYKSGGSFKSAEISSQIVSLKDLRAKLDGIGYRDALIAGDYDFFHYTNDAFIGGFVDGRKADRAAAYENTRKNRGFEKIFEYVKKRSSAANCCQIHVNRGFYVAADPYSSATYGSHQLKLTLDPETKVAIGAATATLGTNGAYAGAFYESLNAAYSKQASKAPSCPRNLVDLLILEDSGVEMVLSNFGYERLRKGPWFFLLNSKPIRQACFR